VSLLNQVLQDLQDRQAPDANAAQATLRDVRIPVRGTRAARRPWVLWTAIVILAGVSGNLLWQRGQEVTATPVITHDAAAPTHSVPPASPAADSHPAQQQVVSPSEATTATSQPTHTIPTATAPVATVASVDHTRATSPNVQPTPAPHMQTPAPASLAPQSSATADTDAAAATAAPTVVTKNTAKAITSSVNKPTAAPHNSSVEKTARPLSAEQQAELAYQDALRLLQSGRPSAAEPRLRTALDSYPAHRGARTTLAGLLINAGRLPEATTVLAAGLALAPTYAPFAKLYARLRIDQGELRDARAVLERAAPPVQDDPEYHALLAALYQRLGLYEQAAQTYRGTLQAQPRNGVWWLGLGLALEGAGDRTNALQAYQRAQQSGTLDSEVLRYVESKITALR
jgi:MSHA biogenesis protein MshN